MLVFDGLDIESVLPIAAVRDVLLQGRIQLHWLRIETEGSAAPDRGVSVYTLWHGPAEHRAQMEALIALANESGGSVRPIRAPDEAEKALAELVADLRGQYALGYAAPEGGGRSAPRVRVRGGGEVKIRTLDRARR